jgi:hypothetical protein
MDDALEQEGMFVLVEGRYGADHQHKGGHDLLGARTRHITH